MGLRVKILSFNLLKEKEPNKIEKTINDFLETIGATRLDVTTPLEIQFIDTSMFVIIRYYLDQ